MNSRFTVVLLAGLAAYACRQADRPRTSSATACPPPPHGVLIGPDTLAYFPAGSKLVDLDHLCPVGRLDIYTIGGYQAPARVFAFAGATLTAVQSQYDDDSLRLT